MGMYTHVSQCTQWNKPLKKSWGGGFKGEVVMPNSTLEDPNRAFAFTNLPPLMMVRAWCFFFIFQPAGWETGDRRGKRGGGKSLIWPKGARGVRGPSDGWMYIFLSPFSFGPWASFFFSHILLLLIRFTTLRGLMCILHLLGLFFEKGITCGVSLTRPFVTQHTPGFFFFFIYSFLIRARRCCRLRGKNHDFGGGGASRAWGEGR